jgi:hypothetical protein
MVVLRKNIGLNYKEIENQYTEDCIKLEKVEKLNEMKRKGFIQYG